MKTESQVAEPDFRNKAAMGQEGPKSTKNEVFGVIFFFWGGGGGGLTKTTCLVKTVAFDFMIQKPLDQ